jgi:hypothetical protein
MKNKVNSESLIAERNLLKITLDHLALENEVLKRQLDNMTMTVQTNKDLLKEYVEIITSKDEVIQKLNNTIEQLQHKMGSLKDPKGNKMSKLDISNDLEKNVGITLINNSFLKIK